MCVPVREEWREKESHTEKEREKQERKCKTEKYKKEKLNIYFEAPSRYEQEYTKTTEQKSAVV